MSEIEIIYLQPKQSETFYLDKDENENDKFTIVEDEEETMLTLNPQVKIHNKTEKKEEKPEKKVTKRPNKKSNKIIKRIFAFFVIFMFFGVIAFNMGYLPIKALLHVPEPVGCVGEINIQTYEKDYPELSGVPNLDNIKYKIFISDATIETIANNYKYDLKEKGYELEYQGVITKKGMTFHYYGFVKGITAVGIILTSDLTKVSSTYETVVLSTIGSVYDYKEIINWCRTNIDL